MVTDFLDNLLEVVGINDEATFQRSMLINQSEMIQTVLQAGEYLDGDYMTRKILTILGDGDQTEEVLRNLDDEAGQRIPVEEPEEEPQEVVEESEQEEV